MKELIRISGLTKRYGALTALDHVNLCLPEGRIIGLLGPNGSGKTTMIKILTGLLCPSEGTVTIDGKPIGPETKAVVSYLPDRMYYASWMKTRDLLKLFQDFYKDFDINRAEEMCRTLGIRPEQSIRSMSKGTKEKLQLIVVMSRRAKLYLLDEPIAGVDPAAREFILNTILSNYSHDSTVLISTHLILDVEPVLDEVVFLKNGQLVCYDSVDNIRQQNGKSVDEVFRDIFRMYPQGGAWR